MGSESLTLNPEHSMEQDNKSELIQVSIQPNGVYFIEKIRVLRGIRGKTRGKVDEVIITGIPLRKVQQYCLNQKLIITSKAVYRYDLDNPILFRKDDSLTYYKKEDISP